MKTLSILLSAFLIASTAIGAELQSVPTNKTIKEIVTQQCTDVGGSYTIVCHCGARRDPLAVSLTAVALTKDKKITSQNLGMINPFVEVCTQGMDLQSGLMRETVASRLTEILSITYNLSLKNETLLDEVETLIKIGYLDIDSVLKYVTDDKFKAGMKKRLDDVKANFARAEAAVKSPGAAATDITARAKKFAKSKAINELNAAVGFDIEAAQKVFLAIRAQVPSQSAKMTREEAVRFIQGLRVNSKEIVKDLGTSVLKNAKSGLTGVVRGAVIASAAHLTGFNVEWLNYLDPVNALIETVTPIPAAANTRTQSLAINPTSMYDTSNFVMNDTTTDYLRKNVDFVRDRGEKGSYALFAQRVMMSGLYAETRQKALNEGASLTTIAAMMAE